MSDTTFIIGFGILFVGLLIALFGIADLVEQLHQLKANLKLTRERVSFLEQLHMKEGEE